MTTLKTAAIALVGAIVVACSSSSGGGADTSVYCTGPNATLGIASPNCTCAAATSSDPGNSDACTALDIGANGVCFFNAESCACAAFACAESTDGSETVCSYAVSGITTPQIVTVAVAEAVGAHNCLSSDKLVCFISASVCASSETEITSCSDTTAMQTMAAAFAVGYTAVPDCRAAVAARGSSSNGNTNICPQGPGKCSDGDSSTCNCGTSCVADSTAVGSAYECVKGCATDADCTGFFSGDTPPAQLTCIPASSTMPTPHCGI